jgi:AraC-like DNA-binding protein
MDRLSPLFAHVALRARVFYSGNLCQLAPVLHEAGAGHVHLLRAGTLWVTDRHGQRLQVSEPGLVVLPHGGTHSLQPQQATLGVDLVCAMIDWGEETRATLVSGMPELMVLPLASVPAASDVARLIFDEAFGERCGRSAALERLTEYLLVLLLRHLMDTTNLGVGTMAALANPKLSKAITAMHEQPERAWTLALLAQQCGMSRARFATHFRTTSGVTPLDYLTNWRITLTKSHLLRGRQLKVIAPMVGYTNATALTRAFIRLTQRSPREWVNEERSCADNA